MFGLEELAQNLTPQEAAVFALLGFFVVLAICAFIVYMFGVPVKKGPSDPYKNN